MEPITFSVDCSSVHSQDDYKKGVLRDETKREPRRRVAEGMKSEPYLKEIYRFRHGDQYFGLDVENQLFFKMNKMIWELMDTFPHFDHLADVYGPLQLQEALDSLKRKNLLAPRPPLPERAEPAVPRQLPLTGLGLCLLDPLNGRTMPVPIVQRSLAFLREKSLNAGECHLVLIADELKRSLLPLMHAVEYAGVRKKGDNKEVKITVRTGDLLLQPEWVRFAAAHRLVIDVVCASGGKKGNIDICQRLAEGEIRDIKGVMAPIVDNTVLTLNINGRIISFLPVVLRNLFKIGFKMIFLDFMCPLCLGEWRGTEMDPRFIAEALKQYSIELESESAAKLRGLVNIIPFIHTIMTSAKVYRGCQSGVRYMAVSPEGKLYPCHYKIGREESALGDVMEGISGNTDDMSGRCHIESKGGCHSCGIRYICGGGVTGGANHKHPAECEIYREMAEQAMVVYDRLDLKQKRWVTGIHRQMQQVMPYRLDLPASDEPDNQARCLTVKGFSMRPLLSEGDLVMTRPCLPGEIRIGDLVCFGRPVTCHRVIRKFRVNGRWFIEEKGDHQLWGRRLPLNEISARVVALQRNGRMVNIDNRIWRWGNRLAAALSRLVSILARLFLYRKRRKGEDNG